jgi:tRNA(fMet)-specific endonuclease VapC
MILVDTDHLSVLTDLRDARRSSLLTRLISADDTISLPVVAIEEQLRGWLAQIRRARDVHRQIVPYLQLSKLFEFLRDWPIVSWNEPSADRFNQLRSSRVRIGTEDLKIASIALANDALLLSSNLRDFQQVPGLQVEDWLTRPK